MAQAVSRRKRHFRDSGLSQRQIARAVGMSVAQVNGLVNAKPGRHPWDRNLAKMVATARLLRVPFWDLWGPDSLTRTAPRTKPAP